ncbi:TetR/AcrR family transcriptional regulator [Nakamurella sp.]|uniref:TetR/AcrR family transcriptional regulator n=1 Tax=Nakamurella sp. TaxID=1869182 RepID=UPI00378496CE
MPRVGLTRAQLAERAAEIADANGWDRLTLADVAASFGVRLPSLYKHVGSLAELRRDVSVLGARELLDELTAAVVGRAGTPALTALAGAYRTFAERCPGRYAASVVAPNADDEEHLRTAQRLLDVLTAVLAEFGVEGDDAIHAIRALRALLHGFVALEVAGAYAMPLDLDVSYRRMVDGFAAGLTRGRPSAARG